MKTTLLLPHRYKYLGWCLLAVSVTLWVLTAILGKSFAFLQTKTFVFLHSELFGENFTFSLADVDLTHTITGSLFIIGGLLVAFSREKIEDEFIMKLRLMSFKWAVLINYLILLVVFIFVYGFYFLPAMAYNMFTVLILFIVHFHYSLIRNRVGNHEK